VSFGVPTYPYERLEPLRRAAAALEGGAVDLSVGDPCDPPSPAALEALAEAAQGANSYPSSVGVPAVREAAAQWMSERLGARVGAGQVGLCIGTKEFVAGLPGWLRLMKPGKDTVLYPELAYPTYEMGARLAGLRPVGVPVDEHFRLRLGEVSADDAARALLLWVNSPGNPAGQLEDLAAVTAWGQERGVLVASDECYAELTWNGEPGTVLLHGAGPDCSGGVLAVHSLSKRSNLAGLRFGWYAGDAEVVTFIKKVRQHAGFMVPWPVQAAGAAALKDVAHARAQRERYRERLARLQGVLAMAGVEPPLPEGGIYLWAPAPGGDAWGLAELLAEKAGLVVSPGELYGPAGEGYVRVAAVAPMERLELLAKRLGG
jgi:succinyldiaminopimelate transaminase